jgi:adenylate cyclase
VHLVLAMWALLRRRTLWPLGWEWTQFTLGWSIILLGALHVVGTRIGHDYFGIQSGYPGIGPLFSAAGSHRAPVHPAARGVDPRLHRHPLAWRLRLAVPRLAAGALRRGLAGAGGRSRGAAIALRDFPSWPSSPLPARHLRARERT